MQTAHGPVFPSQQSIAAALEDFGQGNVISSAGTSALPLTSPAFALLSRNVGALLGKGNNSWPITAVTNFLVHAQDAINCDKQTALIEWIYCKYKNGFFF